MVTTLVATSDEPNLPQEEKSRINRTEQYVCHKLGLDTVGEACEAGDEEILQAALSRRGLLEDFVRYVFTGEKGSTLFPPDGLFWVDALDNVRLGREFLTRAVSRHFIDGFSVSEEGWQRVEVLFDRS